MKNCLVFFALVFFDSLLHVMPTSAQEFAFNRVSLSEENAVPFITSIAQDAKGYMWFTGTSLYRYDGYHYFLFTYKIIRTIHNP